MNAPGIIVDLFAGGGGASLGIEMAFGRSPDVAINHDPVAVAMHAANHPDTLHMCQDIWTVDPATVLPGRVIEFLWASPDCKHFSKAKGGAPKDRNIRDLAWNVVRWLEVRDVQAFAIENVEEFRTWGPVGEDGQPVRGLEGHTFEDFIARIRKLGYRVEWRELRACDYGAPTIRKRLIIIGVKGGRPRWPVATHGNPKADGFKPGRMKPWVSAAEIIDWSLPCPSIFATREGILAEYGLRAVRPLADNTGARVARGIRRYVLDASEPFIVNLTHGARIESAAEPLRTVTCANRGEKAVVAPVLTYAQQGGACRPVDGPLHTVTASRKDQNQLAACFVAQHNNDSRRVGGVNPGREAGDPLSTVTATGSQQGVAAALIKYYGTGDGQGLEKEPLHTVTTRDRFGLAHAAVAAPPFRPEHENRAREVAAFIRHHGQWPAAEDGGGEFVTLEAGGCVFIIVDIGLRMLTPRELFRAQGFPDGYIIDRGPDGEALSKSGQVGRAGNSVCPPLAAAVAAAMRPDLASIREAAE